MVDFGEDAGGLQHECGVLSVERMQVSVSLSLEC